MDDQNNNGQPKYFDISRAPVPPPSTSKPIITGHTPVMPDPMVHRIPVNTTEIPPAAPPASTQLNSEGVVAQPVQTPAPQQPDQSPLVQQPSMAQQSVSQEETAPVATIQSEIPAMPAVPPAATTQPAPADIATANQHDDQTPQDAGIDEEYRVHLPAGEASHHSNYLVWIVLLVVAVAAGGVIAFIFTR